MKIFLSTRLKLTAWYLLIIMIISGVFSFAAYRLLTAEVERSLNRQRILIEQRGHFTSIVLPQSINPEVIDDVNNRIKWSLIFVNLFILAVSGFASYFLAGKTLQPIEDMLNEQKRFVTDASHELRTPLTSLRTTIEVNLRDKKLGIREARKLLASNLEDVAGLQQLSDGLIKLARYERGSEQVVFELTQIKTIVLEAVRKVAIIAENKHIAIKTEIQGVRLRGDVKSLVELVTIFLDNAIKYSPAGSSITVVTRKNNFSAEVLIKDQGIGIPKKDLARVFNRFYRSDSSRQNSQTNGYGLGLSIAQRIIEVHGGSIDVKSEVGKGTTFSIKLPRQIDHLTRAGYRG